MEIYRVKKGSPEWLYKAYDYVRTDAFCFGQNIPIEIEFSHDDPSEELFAIVLVEEHKPMGGCRITYPKEGIGKIERVCVVREKQKSGYGSILIKEAEKWLTESGIKHIVINSQDRAAGFYNKLGYVTNLEVSPSIYEKPKINLPTADEEQNEVHRKNLGFTCVLVEKYINE